MAKAKVPAQEIIVKIKTSRCHFDTNPNVIDELMYRGVPASVIQAMLDAPYGSAGLPSPVIPPVVPKAKPETTDMSQQERRTETVGSQVTTGE